MPQAGGPETRAREGEERGAEAEARAGGDATKKRSHSAMAGVGLTIATNAPRSCGVLVAGAGGPPTCARRGGGFGLGVREAAAVGPATQRPATQRWGPAVGKTIAEADWHGVAGRGVVDCGRRRARQPPGFSGMPTAVPPPGQVDGGW